MASAAIKTLPKKVGPEKLHSYHDQGYNIPSGNPSINLMRHPMKLSTLTLNSILGSTLAILMAAPFASIAGDDFDKAFKEATAEIDKAKAANYEWRDSRKILQEAEKAEKKGDHATAMKLVNKAKQQGIVAVAQSKQQKNAEPH